jgi:hypothetical protein
MAVFSSFISLYIIDYLFVEDCWRNYKPLPAIAYELTGTFNNWGIWIRGLSKTAMQIPNRTIESNSIPIKINGRMHIVITVIPIAFMTFNKIFNIVFPSLN